MKTFCAQILAAACLLIAGDAVKLTALAGAIQRDAGIFSQGIAKVSAPGVSDRSQAKQAASDMEKMVMALAQQVKARKEDPTVANDSANITAFVEEIQVIVQEMLQNVMDAAAEIETACTESLSNATNCPTFAKNTTFYPPGFEGDFGPLREVHKGCYAEIPGLKDEADRCERVRESLIVQEQLALDEFNALNEFKSPEECVISETDVEAYLLRMWQDHFEIKAAQWWAAYYKLHNITQNITANFDCTDKVQAYYAKKGDCLAEQLALEEMACDVYERVEEGCNNTCNCIDERWDLYTKEVASLNNSLYDLKIEYRATKRIDCLLTAFSAADMDAAIDACIEKRHDTSSVNSTCVASYNADQKPSCSEPDVCSQGITVIEHPDTEAYRQAEYELQGITLAGPCYADCCTSPMYTWVTLPDRWITSTGPWFTPADSGTNEFFDMEVAKQECELATTVKCYGIYDSFCNGPTLAEEESDGVKLIGHPEGSVLTADALEQSSAGSCVLEMAMGNRTTLTTTMPDVLCKYEVNVSRSAQAGVWKTFTFENQIWDEAFRFNGCSVESDAGQTCVTAQATTQGVRTIKTREGTTAGEGVCCNQETNAVVGQKRVACNGYKDAYEAIYDKKVDNMKLITGEVFNDLAAARERCLRLGASCWGMMDYSCEGSKFALVNGEALNEATDLLATPTTCLKKKLADQ
eukprot:gb/GFBE01078325.1/.p1 GENE.gb/GFBE01078325.1/~~gb/GFBE01078325.1/.p1  ORF type:complete len:695 (+),score=214.16 gb/GFBE01078325.1/:1-2085(+)